MDQFFSIKSLTAIKKAIDEGRAANKPSWGILCDATLSFVELYVEEMIAEMQPPTPPPSAGV
jgi:hypothetical protein